MAALRYKPAAGDQAPFYVTSKRSGKTLAVVPSRDVTDAVTGAIVQQYRLVDPLRYDFTDRHRIDGRDAARYWERIEDPAEAKRRWDAQVAAIPEYTSHEPT